MVRLLELASPCLEVMQAAAAIKDFHSGTDESGDTLDQIRGICQQVEALLARIRKEMA